MDSFIKKNINSIISIFLLLGPILDLFTGICINSFKINLTIGIITRIIFLLFIVIITIFIFKKKKIIIPYLIIGLYFILYVIGIIIYKDGIGLFKEIQNLVKVFYFPILFISLYSIRNNIRISKYTFVTTLFIYLLLIFIPTMFNIGYKTYEITKAGTLGFFNSANEISGIISLLTPIVFILFVKNKKVLFKVLLVIIYLIVILMMGTKTPLLTLIITIGLNLIYIWIKYIKEKKYKYIIISLLIVLLSITSLIIVLPKTNFYKNIKTHLDYLEVDNVIDVFKDKKLVDHFIFSQRLTFLERKNKLYNKANLYQKVFGIGYLKENGKSTKLIEMDYFDIFYHHGIIGFILFFTIYFYLLFNIFKRRIKDSYTSYMIKTSIAYILILSFFTGHIITAPAVSLISILLILSLEKRLKKDLLFADVNMKIGGIEIAQINLLNKIDYNKYNVTLVLEEKTGELLNRISKEVNIKELKVSNNKIVIIRKIINYLRKFNFKLLNYNNYDFSCCYTTYSYSSNIIAKIASNNNAFYVHSDYKNIYDEKDFRKFFDSRKVSEYKCIIFVSNESKNSFLEYYNELKDRTFVFNNFIDVDNILIKSKEEISEKKSKDKKLFVFVGRLDDSSKKLKRAINLAKNISDIELWIIGDGQDRKVYEEYAKEIENVKFLGKKTNPYPYMKEADYIILTSDYEGFPVTYLEALALNKEIITTINTSDEFIDMKDYAYIISKDEKTMIKEVKSILTKKITNNKLNINDIQDRRMRKLEKLFDN